MLNQEKMQVLLEGRDKLSPAMKKAANNVQEFDKAVSRMNAGLTAIGAAGVAVVAQQIGRIAVDMARVSTEVQRATFSFEHFSGGANTAALNLRAVQTAAGGTLDNLQAMQLATTIMTQGLASNAEGLERITRIAKGVSVVSPVIRDVDSAVSQLSLTIANTSWQRLDQLGTSAGEVRAAMENLGAEYENLSEAQRFEIALLDTLEGKLGVVADAAENQATGLEKLGRAWRDYYQTISSSTGFVNQIAGQIASVLDESTLRATIERMRIEFGEAPPVDGRWQAGMDLFQAYHDAKMRAAGGAFLDEDIAKLNILIDKYYAVGAAIESAANTNVSGPSTEWLAQLTEAIGEEWLPDNLFGNIAEGAEEAAISMRDVGAAVNESVAEFERAATVTEILEGRWQNAGQTGARAAQEYKQQLTDLVFKLQDAGFSAQQIIDLMPSLERSAKSAGETGAAAMKAFGIATANTSTALVAMLKNISTATTLAERMLARVQSVGTSIEVTGKLNTLNASLAESATIAGEIDRAFYRTTGSISAAGEAANGAFSDIQSKVSGLISGAIGPVAGVDANDLLPREDAINENARRLADIAKKGLAGQDWLGEFAAEVPGVFDEIANSANPQEAAARILRDFQDGLRPELIDTERAKELVLRAIRGDENTAALVQQVAEDIAREQGIALQTAQAAAQEVLGGGSGEGSGGSTEIAKSLELDEKRAQDAGARTGKSYGSALVGAFRENVPVELIDILTLKVTPEVLSAIQTERSRAGAN